MPRYTVQYRVLSRMSVPATTVTEGTVEVEAANRKAARAAARDKVEDTDYHYDDRIQPVVAIDFITPIID